MRVVQKALTFDDVLLLPAHSSVVPRDVSLQTRLTTDHLAEHPAVVGGDGYRHRSPASPSRWRRRAVWASCTRTCRRERRRREVAKVKRFESGVVKDPITVPPTMSVREVLALTRQHRISGLPVVDGKKVVGIVTNRDLRFETNLDQPVANIMTQGRSAGHRARGHRARAREDADAPAPAGAGSGRQRPLRAHAA